MFGIGERRWDLTPIAQAAKATINKWDYIQLKSLAKQINKQNQNQGATYGMGEKSLQTICQRRD